MALKQVRIGSLVDVFQYDDGVYSEAIDSSDPIKAGTPVDPSHVVRLSDIGGITAGFTIGSFTRDTSVASGQQTISGLGFAPTNIIFFANVTQTTEVSIGVDQGSISGLCITNDSPVSAGTWRYESQYSIYLLQSVGIYYTGRVNTFNADGFVMDWWKTGAKVGTASILYLAIG